MRRLIPLFLMCVVCACSGCVVLLAGAAGGAGTAVWMSNKLGQDVNGPQEQAVKATKEALEELKLPVSKETQEKETVQIRSEYLNKEPIWVDIRSISAKSCRLEVRVGITGDKEATRKVFDAIMKRM